MQSESTQSKIRINTILLKGSCISMLAPFAIPIVEGQTKDKPNVVFILADDLGWKDLGCYGNQFNETPNIDSLAHSGLRFTQSYSSSPVSSPSRASILTGKHSASMKITNYLVGNKTLKNSPILPAKWQPFLSTTENTIAEVLKTVGYKSGIVGKWHLGSEDNQTSWAQGFDYSRIIGKNGLDYYNYSIFIDSYKNEFKDNGSEYLTDKLTNYGLDFIEKYKNDHFFLYLSYSAPHVMLVPKSGTESKYLKKYQNTADKNVNPYYAAMIESLDQGVGKIIKSLRDHNLLENTIIIFTSDNGGVVVDEMGPIPTSVLPLKGGKGSLYEGGIRVPTIVSWKSQIEANKTSDFYFSNIDYAPTIYQLCGVGLDQIKVDGKSLVPNLINTNIGENQQDTLFWHYPHFSNQGGKPASAIRVGDYKLIEFYENKKIELYNLKTDIGEKIDISNQYPKKKEQLYNALLNWKRKTSAELPIPNPDYKSTKNSKQPKISKQNHESD